jgi:hypothetical protein
MNLFLRRISVMEDKETTNKPLRKIEKGENHGQKRPSRDL